MKYIDSIIQSNTPPQKTNALWDKDGVLYVYRNGDWEPLVASESSIKDLMQKISNIETAIQKGITSSYMHIAYANSKDGTKDFSLTDPNDKAYLGIYTDSNKNGSKNPKLYKWTRIKGEVGPKGEEGPAGIDGTNGVNGAPGTGTYFHIKFSNYPDGKYMNDESGIYIGTYVDDILEDSDDPKKYAWRKFEGQDGVPGEQGIPGENGKDGKTSYLHIAYANSADGSLDFSVTEAADKIYIGQYVDFDVYDSLDPEKYNWTRVKGEQGDAGIQFYTWLRYADHITFDNENNPIGGVGMSDSPLNDDGTFKKYMGFAYNQVTPEESDDYKEYKWSFTTGADGKDGISAEDKFTWIKYADIIPSSPAHVYDEPKSTTEYIGIAINQTQSVESYDPSVYTWSKFKGDKGIQGERGIDGVDGKSYEYIYKLTENKDVVPDIKGMESPNEDGYEPYGWQDNPRGVSDEYKAEWVCTRIKTNGVWGVWKGPTVWSTFGEKGQDGGDLQYVYKRTSSEETPDNPTPKEGVNTDEYQEINDYKDVEFIPVGWTDEPMGVTDKMPFEWTAVRIKKNGKWRPFSTPSLWAKYGKDGKDGNSIKIKGYIDSESDLPMYPEDTSDCYVIGNDLYIWVDTFWKNVGQFKGDDGDNGISIEWKGSLSTHPQSPEEGWAYRNTEDKTSYIFRNGEWQVMTKDGETAYVLELSNDADSIECDYDGNVVDKVLPECKATLYFGSSAVQSTNVDWSIRIDDDKAQGITITNEGELSFSSGYSFYNNVIRITIMASYNEVIINKVFTLSKNKPGSPGETVSKTFLKPSASVISIHSDGTVTPTTISAICYTQVGSQEPYINEEETLYYEYDKDIPGIIYDRKEINVDTTRKFITFGIRNTEGDYYELEKVPIVRDGEKGEQGEQGEKGDKGDKGDPGDSANQNLLVNSAEVLTWESEWTHIRIPLPIRVNAGEKYTFKCEKSELLTGTHTSYFIKLDANDEDSATLTPWYSVDFGENNVVVMEVNDGVSDSVAMLTILKQSYPDSFENKARFRNVSLVKGTIPMSEWQDYQGDNGLKNLISRCQSDFATIVGESKYSHWDTAHITVNGGEIYSFMVEYASITNDTGFSIGLHDSVNDKWVNIETWPIYIRRGSYATGRLEIAKSITLEDGTVQDVINKDVKLLIYAGQVPATGKTLQLTNFSLVKGSRPLMAWKENPDYLTNAFKKGSTKISGGLTMTQAVMVEDENGTVRGMLNGSDWATDSEHGRLMLATGSDGSSQDAMKAATTRIYEDGTVISKDVNLAGVVSAAKGNIGLQYFDSEYYVSFKSKSGHTNVVQEGAGLSVVTRKNANSDSTQLRVGIGGILNLGGSWGVEDKDNGFSYDTYMNTYTYGGVIIEQTGISNPALVIRKTNSQGSDAISCEQGHIRVGKGMFYGLRPYTRDVSSGTTLNEYDHNVFIASGTIYLPSSPLVGQTYDIFHTSTTKLTISASQSIVGLSSSTSTSQDSGYAERIHLVYTGSLWYGDRNRW